MSVGNMELVFPPTLLPPVGLATALLLFVSAFLLYLRQRGGAEPSKVVSINGEAEKLVVAEPEDANKPRCLLVFGTQTGTAERFAKQLKSELQVRYGSDSAFDVIDAEEYKAEEKLPSEKLIFFLLATYGDGEPTDNAADLYNWLVKASQDAESEEPLLKGVSYAMFGLGNRQYEHFCSVGKRLCKAMNALGASLVGPRGDGDDDEDIEADFDKWRTELYEALDKSDLLTNTKDPVPVSQVLSAGSVPSLEVRILTGAEADSASKQHASQGTGSNAHSPYAAPVLCVRELHQPASDRSCLHVELDTSGSEMTYEAGDHVGVSTENSREDTEAAAKLLDVPLDTVLSLHVPDDNTEQLSVPFTGAITLREALRCHVDLLSPINKPAIQIFAAFASGDDSARLKHLLSPEGLSDYKEWHRQSRCLLELMQEFPKVKPSLGAFFGSIAPRLQVRFYSISSGPGMHPRAVHITCAVVREATATGRMHTGVCSRHLGGLKAGDKVSAFIRHSALHLPTNPQSPVVMVGPGTGLAPFRGFLQQRASMLAAGQKLGPAVLFFGCRHRQQDFIYEEELKGYQESGVLAKLFVAFSRDGTSKDYVQGHMLQQAAQIADMLQSSADGHFYVCGDAKNMAKDVHRMLHTVLQQHKAITASEAEAVVQQLTDSGRYMRDVW